jgi:hypothetical protein
MQYRKLIEIFLSLKKLKEKDSEREREGKRERETIFLYSLKKIKVSLCFTIKDKNLCFVSFHALKIIK